VHTKNGSMSHQAFPKQGKKAIFIDHHMIKILFSQQEMQRREN
jgi:nanoRNase/pAp phosphatase (c-di-AMP/oligoRNAs hydrolase)